jgi:DNA modification methylase
VERVGDAAQRIVWGDALDVASTLHAEGLAGKVDAVYVDPPYASQADYVLEARLDGPADGRVRRAPAYADTWGKKDGGIGAYLDSLAPRLDAAARLLAPTGTLWVHLDWRAAYFVRVLLDELLGRDAFVNEIVWRRAPNLGRQAASAQFGRTLDTLVVYGKKKGAALRPPTRLEPIEPAAIRWDNAGRPFTTAPRGDYTDASIERLEREGRVHRTATGRVYIKYFLVQNAEGTWCRERRVDALWTDVAPLRHAATSERTGFPTQKPLALLERVLACATPPGGLVVDLYGGSGTTAVAAHALGRRAILGDASALAVAMARARLLRAGAGIAIDRAGPEAAAAGPAAGAGAVAARAKVQGNLLSIALDHPKEPLAWAIDPAFDERRGFATAWHAERIPGARPTHPPLVAELPWTPHALRPAVRVFFDDGSFVTHAVDPAGVSARSRARALQLELTP